MLGVSLNYGRRLKTEIPVETQYIDGASVKLDSYRGFGHPWPKLQFTEQAGESQDLIT